MDRQRRTFTQLVADARANPLPPVSGPPGLAGDGCWFDRSGHAFVAVDDALSPDRARELVRRGAGVVYDACRCGGRECPTPLRWLGDEELAKLGAATPTLHPSKNGSAALEHWRSADEQHLVVVVNEVTWGATIRG